MRILRDLKLYNDTIYQVKMLADWIERSICRKIAFPDGTGTGFGRTGEEYKRILIN